MTKTSNNEKVITKKDLIKNVLEIVTNGIFMALRKTNAHGIL